MTTIHIISKLEKPSAYHFLNPQTGRWNKISAKKINDANYFLGINRVDFRINYDGIQYNIKEQEEKEELQRQHEKEELQRQHEKEELQRQRQKRILQELTGKKITNIEFIPDGTYVIKIDTDILEFEIDDQQNCCENWGIVLYDTQNPKIELDSNIIIKKYTTSIVSNISEIELEKIPGENDACTLAFCIETDRGPLIICMYNSHNGYYSHEAKFTLNGELVIAVGL